MQRRNEQLASEIEKASRSLGVGLARLNELDARSIVERFVARYVDGPPSFPLWESAFERVRVQDADAWRWIAEFVGRRPTCLWIGERETALVAYELEDGSRLTSLLAECSGFEFYVANQVADYAFCFNHHDFLIATGTSAAWLRERGGY